MRQTHLIDPHKGITFLAILSMMAIYNQWENPTVWVCLALHGTYGLLWVLKSRILPDRQWEQPCSPGYALVIVGGLTLCWIAPWLLAYRGVQAPPWYLGVCISLYSLGVFLHFASDMQKHPALKLRPGLITDGLFSRCRNPNYVGELLIYLGFGLLAVHWIPVAVIGLYIAVLWYPNMRRKDRSLAHYPEFAEWKKRTKLFIPFVV